MTHATLAPALGATEPYLLHLRDTAASTRTHYRLLHGGHMRIERAVMAVVNIHDAQAAYAHGAGFLLCPECVQAQSAQARARREEQAHTQHMADLAARKDELLSTLVDAHLIGGDTRHLLSQLAALNLALAAEGGAR
ncbi:hypothetical protein [Corynebacterium lowii]|uniref:Uncharacterized protein n=1 Tax=Corynebacterium lowii TaxID=1544413 RepID=A0A0Q1AJM6_9CORY|nr:hypothetical protein [Corynebacterium lowii]KQB87060.1 hypothetical protein Clow_00107 [Corynebacterium lowii]MDP9852356.1 hypothetical protein [Corynebacterium lowii]